jgi:molybdate transport system substrate-binding protein
MSVDFISEEEIEKLLRFVPSSIEEAVIVTDIYTHILFMNYTAEKLTGYSKASVYGRTIVEAFGIFNEKTSELVEVSKEKINGVTLKFGDYTSLITGTGKKLSIAGSISPIKNEADEIIGLVILLRNVTEQKQFEKQLQYISTHDALTGSYNRVWFEDEALRKKVEFQPPVGVIVCDVDGLKMINDTLGHKTGDEILISTVRILKECIPEEGMVARIGGSGILMHKIEQGALADIFIPAASSQMDDLQMKDLIINDSRKDLLRNTIALITLNKSNIQCSFKELIEEKIQKIAIGDPNSVPAGKYAQEVLMSLGISEIVKSKLVFAKDVRQVLKFVEKGSIDVGVVYQTDVGISDKVKILDRASEELHSPVVYPIAIMKATDNKAESEDFIKFLTAKDSAKKIFKKHGFITLD